jgi:hypothetical protein
MSEDFYSEVARYRIDAIEAEKAQVLADLQTYRIANDYSAASDAVQKIATLEADKAALIRLHQQHQQAMNPPPPAPQSREQWRVKPAEQMTPEDALQVFSNSKYFPQDPASDPDFVRRYQQGVQEAARRRAYESGR